MRETSPFHFAGGDPLGLPVNFRSQLFLRSSPFRSHYSSAVPFSWEHEPGIPKNPSDPVSDFHPSRIPLPPPIRSSSFRSRKKRSEGSFDADPFALALAECAKEPPAADPDLEDFLRRSSAAERRRTASWSAAGGGFGLFGLYSSCKAAFAAGSVADSMVRIPRSGLLNRRFG
ncbi:hypothetical protein AXF42_Ash016796 [Apostasia shenzhenica]|uniref:Uncharacterized protein n=1 Tax=Apostasia shenzhenica TaxID=1088818 RepID=A0A2I0BAF2_9ASPA|nr:hypothetical protein AXF42_Ash016796 [Apostasia shenzhenica]